MGTPTPKQWDLALNDFAGTTIRDYVRKHYDPAKDVLLDIGAGWAKYHLLLPEFTMDAVEIFEPYVKKNRLREQYRNVFVEDACSFAKRPMSYSATIIGDTLEHIAADDAVKLITNLIANGGGQVIAAVPYLMPQEEVEGNRYEEHLQPDLTPEVMTERFPMLERIAVEGSKGIYVSRRTA